MNEVKLTIPDDCGNAPRKAFLRDFNIAFAKCDVEFITGSVADDIEWNIYGDKRIIGKTSFDKVVAEMACYRPEGLIIHRIITHGKEATVNGEVIMEGKRYAFCDVYEFVSAGKNIIKRMDSYVLRAEFS